MKLTAVLLLAQLASSFSFNCVAAENYNPNIGFWSSSQKETEQEKLFSRALFLEEKLNRLVIGQEEAVQITANAILRFAAGINDPKRPIATLLYCGPSGVGKTELAKQLATTLYDNSSRFIYFNMAEFADRWSATRLLGSAPGYVDSHSGGQLTNALIENPYSVVLFDEIEKADPHVRKILLQLFDEGTITSAMGQKVDARGCIFILTSNLNAVEIASLAKKGSNSATILERIKPSLIRTLSPEFVNRTEIVVFMPLSHQVMISITYKLLDQLKRRIADAKKIELEFDQSVIDYLLVRGFDPVLGARPLERIIEKELTSKVAAAIIRQECKRGDRLLFSVEDDTVLLTKY